MVEKIKSEGLSPSVLIAPEVKVALRQFFLKDSRERMALLHGDIDEARMVVTICDITIPPQVSGPASVETDEDYDGAKFFAYHDEFIARHKEHPFIGQAHSFATGAHHSARDDNTDSLHGTDGSMFGDRVMFVSVTASSVKHNNDFRCDVVVTPRGMPQYNIVHEEVSWSFLADGDRVETMLVGAEERISTAVTAATVTTTKIVPVAPGPKPVQGKREKWVNFEKREQAWLKKKKAWDDRKKDDKDKTKPAGGGSKK